MKTGSLMTQINTLIDKKINAANLSTSVGSRNQLYKYKDTSMLIGATDSGMALLWNEAGVTKMAIGILKNKDGLAIPLMAFGAGNGYGDNRGYIHKDTTGLAMYYIGTLASNEVAGIKILKNAIETTHPITVNKGLVDEFVLNATNWNAKLTEITAKAILENSSKNWEIPQENLSTAVGVKLDNGNTAYGNMIAGLNSTYIADAAITTAKLANLAVDNSKLAALAVDAAKLATGAVTTTKIFDDAITAAKIATGAVTSDAIASAAITTAKISNAAITTALIDNAAITTALINDAAITSAKIADLAVGSTAIQAAAIGTAHIANGTIINAHIEDATITSAKIGSLNAEVITGNYLSTQGWTGTGTNYIYMSKQMQVFKADTLAKMAIGFLPNKDNVNVPIFVIGAGDGYGNNRGYIEKVTNGLAMYYIGTLTSNEVAGLKILKNSIETTHPITVNKGLVDEFVLNATNWNAKLTEATAKVILENPAKAWEIPQENLSGTLSTKIDNVYAVIDPNDLKVLATKIKDASITTAKIANLAVDNSKLANLAVDAAKLATGAVTTTKIFDGAISSAKIADSAIITAKLAAGAVDSTKLADLAVTAAKIGAGAVTSTKILDDAITSAKIATGAVTTDAIAAANITTAKIANAAITTALINNLAVDSTKIADAAITSAKIGAAAIGAAAIANGAIGTAHIGTGVIQTAHIADGNITNAKIGSAAITSAKIATAAITSAKIADLAVGYAAIQAAAIGEVHIGTGVIKTAHIGDAQITSAKIDSLAANKIVAGTLTGFTIQTAASRSNRIVMSSTGINSYNSSNQAHGLCVNPSYADLSLYYNGSEMFKVYNSDYITGALNFYAWEDNFLGYNNNVGKTYPKGTWNFSSCTVEGFTVKFGA